LSQARLTGSQLAELPQDNALMRGVLAQAPGEENIACSLLSIQIKGTASLQPGSLLKDYFGSVHRDHYKASEFKWQSDHI